MLFPILNILYFYISTFRSVCAVPKMAFFLVPQFCAFSVNWSSIFWIILRWFQLPILLLISLLFSHYPRVFVKFLHFKNSSASFLITIPSPRTQHLLPHMFLFHYRGLWCPVFFCKGWSCRFERVDSIIWLLLLISQVLHCSDCFIIIGLIKVIISFINYY